MKANPLIAPIRMGLAITLCTFPSLLTAGEINVTPPPEKAAVVVYRPAKLPGVILQANEAFRVAYDGQWISSVSRGTHFVFYAWPGAHKIEPSLASQRTPDDRYGSSTLNLDVKAGETYYVKAAPPDTPSIVAPTSSIAFALMDKESAQKALAESKPVDWAKDLVEGTLAEVHPLSPQAEGASTECKPVEWSPDVDSLKNMGDKRSSLLKGRVVLRDESLLLQLQSASDDAAIVGVTIPYADIATVEVRNKVLNRIVLITRKNGRLDSFSVTTAGGGRIDRGRTAACGEQLAGKLGS
jgi:hypothetical protein